jgi:hypothetical protein
MLRTVVVLTGLLATLTFVAMNRSRRSRPQRWP